VVCGPGTLVSPANGKPHPPNITTMLGLLPANGVSGGIASVSRSLPPRTSATSSALDMASNTDRVHGWAMAVTRPPLVLLSAMTAASCAHSSSSISRYRGIRLAVMPPGDRPLLVAMFMGTRRR